MKSKALIISIILIFTLPCFAWSNHAGLTYIILKNYWKTSPPANVKAESLANFLNKEKEGIKAVLSDADEYGAKLLPHCPKPDISLVFRPEGIKKKEDLVPAFFRALRVFPNHKPSLYVQSVLSPPQTNPSKELANITTLKDKGRMVNEKFLSLAEGANISPLDVVATAVDEPDYDLDFYLFTDNDSEFGKIYGFGTQPFGDPRFEYSSQAPFHMGFFHESSITLTVASFLKRTYPEYRIYQFTKLAEYAFKTGHTYWGYRFSGWALHYIQDLTQPYHSSVLPRVGFGKRMGVQLLSVIGINSPKANMVEYVVNRHSLIEEYQYNLVRDILLNKKENHPVYTALSVAPEKNLNVWKDFSYIRDVVSKEAYTTAEDADLEIEHLNIIKYESLYPVEHPINGIIAKLLSNTSYHTRVYAKTFFKP
ncbi:hypothetical protein [Leptospira ilyithenensis]|uniref:Phospholipase n=1 Tax=Leptospira ilyithenensis TaxID=2484901 RepID=A0A4R9LUG6_9LEPT|nr:hypothetical protein [Leptospira ilyithenensis]TGN14116.1 hypothetical protein EHS11_02575 [Leptospira ilyithenensis]